MLEGNVQAFLEFDLTQEEVTDLEVELHRCAPSRVGPSKLLHVVLTL